MAKRHKKRFTPPRTQPTPTQATQTVPETEHVQPTVASAPAATLTRVDTSIFRELRLILFTFLGLLLLLALVVVWTKQSGNYTKVSNSLTKLFHIQE